MKNKISLAPAAFYLIIVLSGCTAIPLINSGPLSPYFENGLASFQAPDKENVKRSSLRRYYPYGYDEVWDSALMILQQYAVVTSISKQSGLITYIDIDGIILSKKLYYWEFPFTIFFDKLTDGTMVYIYPMEDIFIADSNISTKKWWSDCKKGFVQKGEEFLDRITVQLTAKTRWPWLK